MSSSELAFAIGEAGSRFEVKLSELGSFVRTGAIS